MSKESIKKLTLADIISKKDQIMDGKKKIGNVLIPSLGGYIVVEKPDRELIADANEITGGMESNVHLVYNCIVDPNLKDKETIDAFGVHTPKELVQVLLNDGEISDVADALMKLAGYGDTGIKLVTDLKN